MGSIGDRVGRYEVLDPLSAGGVGEVYVCRATGALGFERLFAVKVLRAEAHDRVSSRAAFIDEARIVSQVSHPNVAAVIDFGAEPDGRLYLVMEFVAGLTLAQLIRAGRPLSPGAVAHVLAEIAHGLAAAHSARDPQGARLGVVHRDISPQNVMLGFSGEVKIIDFGIALTRDRLTPDTVDGGIKGKPRYMAPEQLDGSTVDHRCDLFALGVVGFELLTRTHLFSGRSMTEILRAVDRCQVDPGRLTTAEVPAALSAIVLRCLRRAPEERFQTAEDLARALEEAAHALERRPVRPLLRELLAEDGAAFEQRVRAWQRRSTEVVPARAEGESTVDQHPPDELRTRAPDEPSTTQPSPTRVPRHARAPWAPVVAVAIVAVASAAGWAAYERVVPRVALVTEPARDAAATSAAATPTNGAPRGATVAQTPSSTSADPRGPVVELPSTPEDHDAPAQRADAARSRAAPRGARTPRDRSPGAAAPADARSAATAPAMPRGSVRALAHPWAYVTIDGDAPRPTPVRVELDVGSHTVVFVDPVDRAVRYRAELEVAAGQEVVVRAPGR
jgi:serine/threonine protein kinase